MTKEQARELLRILRASMRDKPPPIDRVGMMRAYIAAAPSRCTGATWE